MERKIILIVVCIIFIIINLNSQDKEYIVIKNADIFSISDIGNKKIGKIKSGSKCNIIDLSTKREFVNNYYKILVKIKSNNIEGWIFSDSIKTTTGEEFSDNIIGNWACSYYEQAISKKDEKIILENEYDKDTFYNEKAFWSFFNPKIFIITNSTISYSTYMAEPVCFIENIQKIKINEYKVSGIDGITGKKIELVIRLINNKLNIENWNDTNWIDLISIKSNELFNKLDNLRNLTLLKFIKYYTSTTDNLRFRESPDLNGKFIKLLKKGEKLELLDKGKSEEINGIKGTWLKVKTEAGELGWCFDAYLKEIK